MNMRSHEQHFIVYLDKNEQQDKDLHATEHASGAEL